MHEKIDFVIPWVDDTDPQWKAKYDQYSPVKKDIQNNSTRFEDYGTLRYWFRSIERFAPWVNKVYLITDNQQPDWVDQSNPKLVCVNHSEYIEKQYLPTFNSNVIDLNIPNISGLSEQFVLFNDDVFLNDNVSQEDFFKDGKPVDFGAFQPVPPTSAFTHTVINDLLIINKWYSFKKIVKNNPRLYFSTKYGIRNLISSLTMLPYGKIMGFSNVHITSPYLKSFFSQTLARASEEMSETLTHQFRKETDISHWLVKYANFCEGNFIPQPRDFGKYYDLNMVEAFCNDIANNTHKVICINDIDGFDPQKALIALNHALSNKFPNKSTFEK